MIAWICGAVQGVTEDSLIVSTASGVGYEVFLAESVLARLAEVGEVELFVRAVVREDAFDLYGFETLEEREFFSTLISISKLGPKKALAILSIYPPDQLEDLVAGEDLTAFTKVPGIGKKTGQQILIELKFKLAGRERAKPSRTNEAAGRGGVFQDAVSGLVNLGLAEDEAGPLVNEILEREPDLDVGEVLRAALKAMAAKRQ